jgi:hypothetical protein
MFIMPPSPLFTPLHSSTSTSPLDVGVEEPLQLYSLYIASSAIQLYIADCSTLYNLYTHPLGIVRPSRGECARLVSKGCETEAKRVRGGSFRNTTGSRFFLFIYTHFDTPRLHPVVAEGTCGAPGRASSSLGSFVRVVLIQKSKVSASPRALHPYNSEPCIWFHDDLSSVCVCHAPNLGAVPSQHET